MKLKRVLSFIMITALLTGCGSTSATVDKEADLKETSVDKDVENSNTENKSSSENNSFDREIINQVSLLQGLTFGDYNGSVSAGRLKELGDIGIGTFDGLNGELIMVDGVIYRAAGDGTVEEVKDDELIPFSNVTFFDGDEKIDGSGVESIDELKELLNKKVDELGPNYFYMIRMDGTFKEMNVRSEYAQEEPYEPLAKVLETDQTFFDYKDVKGTVVGLYCPPYMDSLNAVGWHFHFVSDDRTMGGHILNLKSDVAEIAIDRTDSFKMILPDNDMFNGFDLTIDQSEDIKKVETGDDTKEESGQENYGGSPMILWEYEGYMDEAEGYSYRDEFVNTDFDGDGKNDRVYRKCDSNESLAYYTIELGNGRKIEIPEAWNTGFPHVKMADLDGDDEKEVLFNLSYDSSTDPFSAGDIWILDYDEKDKVYKEVELPLKSGDKGARVVTVEYGKAKEGTIPIEIKELNFSGDIEVGKEFIEGWWTTDPDPSDVMVWFAEVKDYEGGNAVYCEIEPVSKSGIFVGFYMVYEDGEYKIKGAQISDSSNMDYDI